MSFEWSIKIIKVDNGYIVEPSKDSEGDIAVFEQQDIQSYSIEDNSIKEEQKTLMNVFNHLRDFFGVYNNKHHDQYLDIKVSKGSWNDNS